MPTEVGELLTRDGTGTTGITVLRCDWVVVLSVSVSCIALLSAATAPTSIRKTTLATDGYDEHRTRQTLALLREYCGEDCDGLVIVGGITYRIVDIGMRMLQPHELYPAQGFPEWYIIDQDYSGKKCAKDKQVARCGNAVPPQFAEAMMRANLPEIYVTSGYSSMTKLTP